MIPTLWAELGKVWGSALPTEDTSTDSSLPAWAQIQAMVGDLNLLITENRESLVKAVNELAADKAEIVSEVLAALPLWTGGSF